MNNIPQKGDKLYIPTQLHVYRGIDDIHGGLATIAEVKINSVLPEGHCNKIMIAFKETGEVTFYNYNTLLQQQDELKVKFGNNPCYSDPDYRKEFNCDNGWR